MSLPFAFKPTKDIMNATHWIAFQDKNDPFAKVTVNKMYPLLYFIPTKEIVIKDDEDIYSLIHLAFNGQYVTLVTSNNKI